MYKGDLAKLLTINKKLGLVNLADEPPVDYKSRIEDLDDNSLTVSFPRKKGIMASFKKGNRTAVTITQPDGLYEFRTTVRGRKLNPFPILVLDLPSREEIVRIQRRHFFRLEQIMAQDLLLAQRDQEGRIKPPNSIEDLKMSVHLLNLSGGGVGFKGAKSIPVGTNFHFEYIIEPDEPPLETVVELVWRQGIYMGNTLKGVRFGGKYVNLNNRDQDRIARHTLKQQLIMAQKAFNAS